MDKEHEELIVKAFYIKRVRERILFELFSPKKRRESIGRLSSYQMLLREECMNVIPKPNSDPAEIYKLLKQYGASDNCYVVSYNEHIDGQYLPLLDALAAAVGNGMPSLISCIPGELAYFEAEQCIGPPPRFILKNLMLLK